MLYLYTDVFPALKEVFLPLSARHRAWWAVAERSTAVSEEVPVASAEAELRKGLEMA